jgi:hypothetical protein
MPRHKKKNQPTLFCSSLEMAIHSLHIKKILTQSLPATRREEKVRERGKEVAVIDVLAYVRVVQKSALSLTILANSIYARLTLPG